MASNQELVIRARRRRRNASLIDLLASPQVKKAVINCLLIEYESEIAEGGESHRLPSTGIPFHAMIDSTCRTEYPRFT